ncbi:MAG: DUF4340 domain-containing protein [Thermosynechococcaceae cyanobacterium]
MKIKSNTVALLAIAILTAGGLYLWDRNRGETTTASGDAKTSTPLFKMKEDEITQVSIQTKGKPLTLEKTAKGWQLTSPQSGPADDGTVSFLLNLLATGTSERTLEVDAKELKSFGLDQPPVTLNIQLKNKTTHQLVLGTQTFNQSSVYARVDPKPPSAGQKIAIALVPTGFLDATSRPFAEWKAKPKPATPAPSSPAPSPAPSKPSAP